MKMIITGAIVFAVAVLVVLGVSMIDIKEASVQVYPTSIDYGDIVQADGLVSRIVIVRNIGEKTLQINRLSTSCGCTSAEMDLSDLGAGEEREMKISFDPMVHPDQFGSIVRVVYLQTSDKDNPEIEINIVGNVINPNDL